MSLRNLLSSGAEVFISNKGIIVESPNSGVLLKHPINTMQTYRCSSLILALFEADSLPPIKIGDNKAIVELENQTIEFILEPARDMFFQYEGINSSLKLDILDLCKQVAFVINVNIFRPALHGIYFDGNRMIASDSYRLVSRELPLSIEKSFIMPISIVDKLIKLNITEASIGFKDDLIYVDNEKCCLVSPRINADFPPYSHLLSLPPNEAEFEVEEAIELLNHAKIFEEVGVSINIQRSFITLSLESVYGKWEGTLRCKASIETSEPKRLNISFLLSALRNCPEKVVKLHWKDEKNTPIALSALNQQWLCLIAPLFSS